MTANSVVIHRCGRKSNLFKLPWLSVSPARMRTLSKMKPLEWSQQISRCRSMWIFPEVQSRTVYSRARGWFCFQFKLIQALMVVLVTYKNKDNPIKIKGARKVATLFNNFSDVQGQITQ